MTTTSLVICKDVIVVVSSNSEEKRVCLKFEDTMIYLQTTSSTLSVLEINFVFKYR